MNHSTFAKCAAASLLAAGMFSASSAFAAAITLDLTGADAWFGHDYSSSIASFTDAYLYHADIGTDGLDVTARTGLANRGGNYSGTLSVDVSPVPEPDAFAMAAVGLGLICFRRRPKDNPKLG